ncbi:MAG: hypothetical protein Q8P58_01410 [Candidatus Adlerbacteria bacterium]|nr:hypothetical protein [Candidatus Adlerbacteria bacterium]MDZ4226239.1 hypothetical protein [Patescibacteria group bacterium]
MTGQIYEFPAGNKRMGRWPGVISATVSAIGVLQEEVPGRPGVVTQTPRFEVRVVRVGASEANLQVEVNGVKDLHFLIDILADAAHQHGQGLTVTDYTDGVAKLPEDYRPENQEL